MINIIQSVLFILEGLSLSERVQIRTKARNRFRLFWQVYANQRKPE